MVWKEQKYPKVAYLFNTKSLFLICLRIINNAFEKWTTPVCQVGRPQKGICSKIQLKNFDDRPHCTSKTAKMFCPRAKTFFILRILIFVLLVCGFGWQVYDQVDKFVSKKTTIATRFSFKTSKQFWTWTNMFWENINIYAKGKQSDQIGLFFNKINYKFSNKTSQHICLLSVLFLMSVLFKYKLLWSLLKQHFKNRATFHFNI